MQGLMSAAQGSGEPMGMPEQMQQDAMPDQGGGMPGSARQATPEQQESYNAFVANAMNLMYDKKTMPKLLEMLQGGGDPIEGLARASVMITARVGTSAEEAGQKLSGDVVFNAGAEIVNQLADVATEAGIHDFQNDRDALEGAYFRALDQFRTLMEGAGRLNKDAAQKDLAMLQGMSESGELEQMLRGFAENDPRAPKQAPQGAQPEPEMM
jgi:hypothetical protein